MTTAESVIVQIDVAVDPATAFKVFTEDIGSWYKDTLYSWNDPERAVGTRIEPGVGGRWIEIWDPDRGEGWTIGHIMVWEPGQRLVLSYHSMRRPEPHTEIDIHFEPTDLGTRVTLEHRGWEQLPPDEAATEIANSRIGEPYLLIWFAEHVGGSLAADLGYLTFGAPDPDQAAAFFGQLFGWLFAPPIGDDGHRYRHIDNVAPPMGVNNDVGACPVHGARPVWGLSFRVDDLDTSLATVRKLGGTVDTRDVSETGGYAECRDDQGVPFGLWSPGAAYAASPTAAEARPGQIGYLTLTFPDPARAVAFYREVFGWFVQPGAAGEGHFHVYNTALPMGIAPAGDDEPGPTLYFRVDDVDAVAARVRDMGGDAAQSAGSKGGKSVACHDDQGTPFTLLSEN